MNTQVKRETSWPNAAGLRSTVAFAAFALVGLLLTMGGFQLFDRFGIAITTVMVVAVPIAFLIGSGALRDFISGARALARTFGWQESLWALLFISAMTFEVRNLHEALNQPLDAYVAVRVAAELVVCIIIAWRVASGKSSLTYLTSGLPKFVALYCLVSLISTTWSIVPVWTFFKSAEYSLDVIAAVLIFESASTAEDYMKVLNWTWTVYALETGWAWCWGIFAPSLAWDDMGRLFSNFPNVGPNNIGSTGAVLSLVGISRLLWRPAGSQPQVVLGSDHLWNGFPVRFAHPARHRGICPGAYRHPGLSQTNVVFGRPDFGPGSAARVNLGWSYRCHLFAARTGRCCGPGYFWENRVLGGCVGATEPSPSHRTRSICGRKVWRDGEDRPG